MNQEEFERLQAERAAQANAQHHAQQRLNDYQVWQNVPNGLSGASAQQINISLENERAFRAQALLMAIDFQRTHNEVDVVRVAAEFLAFLKGDANV